MRVPIPKTDIAVRVEQEHACLKRDMKDISDDLAQEVASEGFAAWRLEFLWRLRDFKNHLLRHFDLEEEGGFMSEILGEKPEARGEVQKLEAEHEQILSTLDAVVTDLKALEKFDSSELHTIRKRVRSLLSTIRAHEAAESALIQKVYYQEYGYPSS